MGIFDGIKAAYNKVGEWYDAAERYYLTHPKTMAAISGAVVMGGLGATFGLAPAIYGLVVGGGLGAVTGAAVSILKPYHDEAKKTGKLPSEKKDDQEVEREREQEQEISSGLPEHARKSPTQVGIF